MKKMLASLTLAGILAGCSGNPPAKSEYAPELYSPIEITRIHSAKLPTAYNSVLSRDLFAIPFESVLRDNAFVAPEATKPFRDLVEFCDYIILGK